MPVNSFWKLSIIFYQMKLTHKSYKSNFSTCTGTPVYTPPKLQKSALFQPKVFQQKLRVRNKQTIHKNPKIKCNKKSQPIINFKKFIKNQQQSRQVDWITYNLLNGIYQNWIRLAPSIIHLIQASKKDKLHDIQKLMQRVYEQKQRIQKLINKIKCPRQSFQYFHKKQSHNQQIINLQILDRINIICKQFKCTTQLMNGQIFAQKRIIKSQKENILADYLFSDLIKINRQNKNVFIDDNVTKVAETIVDRIAVVKSLKSKNIKVDKKILKPLQKIFTGLESSKLQKEPITIDKVIKQIIQKFVKTKNTHQNEQNTSNKEVKNLKINFNQSQKNYQIKNQGKQDQRQDIISLKLIQDDIQDKYQTSMANKMQQMKSTTKKKIGFKIDTQSESEQHIKFDKKRTDMLLFNQRKANLDRQMVKNKNKSKNKLIYNLLDQQQDPITRLKQSKFQIKKSNKSQKNCLNQIKSEQDDNQFKKGHNLQSNFLKDSQIKQNLTKKVLSRQYSYQYTSESQQQQIQFNTQNGKYQKLKKNMRKRNLKKHTYAFDLFDLQNFDMELKAQQNVVIKKKKILDLFNTLQAGGVSGSKSIKKILTYAQKIEQQIKTRNNIFKQKMMRNNLSQDGEIASFFRIPYFDANKNNQYSTHSCKPYQYLTKFNKQAVSNWNNHAMRMFRLSDVPKARFSELGCDLNIPIIKKQTIYQDRRWIDRQNKALQFSLQLIRRRNKMAIQQKPLFIQKQNLI